MEQKSQQQLLSTSEKRVEKLYPGIPVPRSLQPIQNQSPGTVRSFEWVITLDPTTGADGLEEYQVYRLWSGAGITSDSGKRCSD